MALLWKWSRGPELALLAGIPIFGYLLAAAPPLEPGRFLFFVICVLAGGAHVMIFNTLLGERTHPGDIAVMDYPLSAREWQPGLWRAVGVVLLAVAIGGLFVLSWRALAAGVVTALLWYAYAHPRTRLKGRPAADTLVHVATGYLQFSIGTFCVTERPAAAELGWASFFTLCFVAGHFHHVIKDYAADRGAGMETVAQRLGIRTAFVLGCLAFAAAYAVLFGLALSQFVSPAAIQLLLAALAIQAILAIAFYRPIAAGNREALVRYRYCYRAIFVGIGGVILWQRLLQASFGA